MGFALLGLTSSVDGDCCFRFSLIIVVALLYSYGTSNSHLLFFFYFLKQFGVRTLLF